MPKISELNAITDLLNSDLIAVAHDVDGLPSTRKITIADFANVISYSVTNNYSYANTTASGVIKVGNNLTVNATGYLNAPQSVLPTSNTNEGYLLTWDDAVGAAVWQAFAGVNDYTLINSSNTHTAAKHENVIFVDPNNISEDITIILPDGTSEFIPEEGKTYTVKNLDPGAGYKVIVTTQSGVDNNSNYIENPVTGTLDVTINLLQKGSGDTWLYNGSVWRHIASQRAVPIFYTSVDSYAQVAVKNASTSNNASTDLVLYNNAADIDGEDGPYIDVGINSTTYNQPLYSVTGPSDGYLYTRAANLAIGTSNTGKSLVLHAGGATAEDIKMVVNTSAVYVNSTMVLINTTPSASPEIINIYSQNKINISANDKNLSIATDGLVTIPGLLKAPQSTKANNSIGTAGMISWDSNNIYVCVGTNSWKKVSLNDF